MDWASENGYESVNAIAKRKREIHYAGKVLLGYGTKAIYAKHISILVLLGWCTRQVPEKLETEIYHSALKLARQQMQYEKLEPENILRGIDLICGSALCSVFGIDTKTYEYVTDGPLSKYKRRTKKIAAACERNDSSLQLVKPLVSLVENVLNETPHKHESLPIAER
jgi:hypothetical protein